MITVYFAFKNVRKETKKRELKRVKLEVKE